MVSFHQGIYDFELEIIPNILKTLKKTTSLDILNWLIDNGVNMIVVPKTDRDMLKAVEKSEVHFILIEPGSLLKEVLESISKP